MAMNSKDLHDIGKPCLEAHAPACIASCPMHVDAKGLIGAVSEGDFAKGFEILKNRVTFASVIGRICDHPCEKKCKRSELEENIEIHKLERACAEYGSKDTEVIPVPRKKKQKVAIVGSGLSSITAASFLVNKGYFVTLFEAKNVLGGRLREIPEDILPRDILDKELSILSRLGVKIILNVTIGKNITINGLTDEFDAVYLGVGEHSGLTVAKTNPQYFTTDNPKVFAGGSFVSENAKKSPIYSMASGKSAAVSIERFFQKVSITANRKNEGVYDTKLYTNLEWYDKKGRIIPENKINYTKEEAIEEAKRCIQCRCVECMKGCTYLKHFNQYPGDSIKSVVKNVNIMPGWGVRYANDFINSCTTCGLCKEMCPVDIDMGFVNREARRLMWEMNYMPPALHDLPLRDMEFAQGQQAAILKHQPGHNSSKFLFFPGCQMTASMPQTVKKTYEFLTANLKGGVGLMLDCCGAPADWAGRQDLSKEIWDEIIAKWGRMGKPTVILGCPGCYKIFKENMPEIEIKIISEVLLTLPLPEKTTDKAFAFHDPCTSRYEKVVQDSARELAVKLGASIEELDFNRERSQCCGYGGLSYHLNPKLSHKFIDDRINKTLRPYLTSCSNCRDFFRKHDKDTTHVLELLWGEEHAITGKDYSLIDFSERRDNRRKLKAELLAELWGEDNSMNEMDYKKIKLIISEELQKKMHDQCILEDDLQEVIDFAEKNNRKMLSPETGHFVTGRRQKIITYWVEYTKEGDAYVIKNCYSHRMKVLTDTI